MYNNIKITIIDYIGKVYGGVLVEIGISIGEEYYDGTFFYTEDTLMINPSREFVEKYGNIENMENYKLLLKATINKVKPYKEIYSELKNIIKK